MTSISGTTQSRADNLARACKIATSTFSDVLDGMKICGVMTGIARRSGSGRVAGFAKTITCTAGSLGDYDPAEFQVFPIFEATRSGDILVFDLGGAHISTFGGLAALALASRGAAGVVIDGACRDVDELRETGLTVASRHVTPITGKGRMTIRGTGEPASCGGITVETGDLIIADDTGIVVVPQSILDAVLEAAEIIELRDSQVADRLRDKNRSDAA